jgi:Amt family ammonium transporter
VQALGVGAVIVWSALASVAILLVVKRVIGLRANDTVIEDGLDLSEHGERAYPS